MPFPLRTDSSRAERERRGERRGTTTITENEFSLLCKLWFREQWKNVRGKENKCNSFRTSKGREEVQSVRVKGCRGVRSARAAAHGLKFSTGSRSWLEISWPIVTSGSQETTAEGREEAQISIYASSPVDKALLSAPSKWPRQYARRRAPRPGRPISFPIFLSFFSGVKTGTDSHRRNYRRTNEEQT